MLEVGEEALREIAKKALEKGTGARGLRSIVEELMLEVVYEMPSREDVVQYTITPEFVRGETPKPETAGRDALRGKSQGSKQARRNRRKRA